MPPLENIKSRIQIAVLDAKLDIIPNPSPSGQSSLLIDSAHAVAAAKFDIQLTETVPLVDWWDTPH